MASEKEKAVELAIEQIERQYGKGSIMKLGEAPARVAGDAIPTGALALDLALGIGGIPRGRVTEIFGSESSGKTTLARCMADKLNCTTIHHTYDTRWTERQLLEHHLAWRFS